MNFSMSIDRLRCPRCGEGFEDLTEAKDPIAAFGRDIEHTKKCHPEQYEAFKRFVFSVLSIGNENAIVAFMKQCEASSVPPTMLDYVNHDGGCQHCDHKYAKHSSGDKYVDQAKNYEDIGRHMVENHLNQLLPMIQETLIAFEHIYPGSLAKLRAGSFASAVENGMLVAEGSKMVN